MNSSEIPTGSAYARKLLLVEPSAASEHIFSILKASFHEQQDSSLQDYIEASLGYGTGLYLCVFFKGGRVMIAFFVNFSTVAFPLHLPTLK